MKEELTKIQVQLSLAEQAEKENKPEKDGEVKSADKPDESKVGEKIPEDRSTEKPETTKDRIVNGEPKHNLLNGDSIDNDSTAVNTPGSSTPLHRPPSAPETTTEKKDIDDSVIPSVESLRLQVLHLQKLLDFLREEFGPTRQKLHDLLENHEMKFGLLWCLFRLGSVITFKDNESGLNMAGEVPNPLSFSEPPDLKWHICVGRR